MRKMKVRFIFEEIDNQKAQKSKNSFFEIRKNETRNRKKTHTLKFDKWYIHNKNKQN